MPLYEYGCASCGTVFEELARSDAPAPACPECDRADAVGRRLSPFLAGPAIRRPPSWTPAMTRHDASHHPHHH